MPNLGVINGFEINGASAAVSIPAEYPSSTRYTCVLTGSPDLTLPISSFQARYRNGEPSYLSVTVPNAVDYADEIDARSSGQIVITRTTYDSSGAQLSSGELLRVDLETIRLDYGSRSSSASLDGHRTTSNGTPQTVALVGASYKNVNAGLRRFRCSPNTSLRPGDTAQINGEEIVVGYITYTVSVKSETMEILEAE